jgi:hypothetical protein
MRSPVRKRPRRAPSRMTRTRRREESASMRSRRRVTKPACHGLASRAARGRRAQKSRWKPRRDGELCRARSFDLQSRARSLPRLRADLVPNMRFHTSPRIGTRQPRAALSSPRLAWRPRTGSARIRIDRPEWQQRSGCSAPLDGPPSCGAGDPQRERRRATGLTRSHIPGRADCDAVVPGALRIFAIDAPGGRD